MTRCRRGHEHETWDAAARCSYDTVSLRDADGRLLESAPLVDEPQQATLELEG